MIEVQHLRKDFGGIRAVDDVSFRVAQGEIVGLLGPNGSGKTTIMRVLAGFFAPTAGQAIVAGFDAVAQSLALRRNIGYLPENVALYPEMRVAEFLEFCARLRRLPATRQAQRLCATIHDCGLREVTERSIGTLSKGYRQRVALAQAMLHEPEVLILDEPTVGLDPRQIVEIRELIRGLRGRTTVLLSTHVLPEVSMTCERVIIMDRGRVVMDDSADALSRRAHGGDRTLVRVDGPADAVHATLCQLPNVQEVVRMAATVGERGCTFVIRTTAGESGREAVAAAVVGHGWGLLEVRAVTASLEDRFLRSMKDDDAETAH